VNAAITAAEVRDLFSYDPETGRLAWRESGRGRVAGGVAGYFDRWRVIVVVGGVRYRVHRLAWLHVHGEWPKHHIDHINGDPQDNRIANLRDVKPTVNNQNRRDASRRSKTGVLGVMRASTSGRFRVSMSFMGKALSVHSFDSTEEAQRCYLTLKRLLHEGCEI
jgi:hypothetical protein